MQNINLNFELSKIELINEIKKLTMNKNIKLNSSRSIKTISICCLALLGFLSLNILFFVLGGLVLAYKPCDDKKHPLQWISGFLLILPVILTTIGSILMYYTEYSYSDDLFDYYVYPYYYEGLPLLILGECLFYSGAIIALIFIVIEQRKINELFDKQIANIESQINRLTIKNTSNI